MDYIRDVLADGNRRANEIADQTLWRGARGHGHGLLNRPASTPHHAKQGNSRSCGRHGRTLRHYRKIGLLREPERAENGYCEYTVNDLIRLLRIKTLSSLGFSLVDIAHMLDADDAAQGGSAYDDKLDELDRELASSNRTSGRTTAHRRAPQG